MGLDIGGSKTQAVVIDDDGAVLATARTPTVPGVAGVLEVAAATVAQALAAAGIERPRAVGVGLPGVVDSEGGVVEHAVNLGIREPVGLAGLLAGRLGVAVRCENDLNAATIGARRVLVGSGDGDVDDLAFLALGTGLAAGLLLDGRLRRGSHGAAGEIGHLIHVAGGLVCPCGQRGCLERYASGSALDAAWPSADGVPAPVAVFAAAQAGDARAQQVRATFVEALAAAVRVLVLTCDVRRVVIGGGVAALGVPLLDALTAELATQAYGSAFLRSLAIADRVRLAPAGLPVGAFGAALLAPDEEV
ncbi:MAG: ROK family protein [Actinobacteria bacterium]|nr:ROK family protein [Actinomycetota bacterium]MCG2802939.1 ROK family protein [Cellulomonas sp.]